MRSIPKTRHALQRSGVDSPDLQSWIQCNVVIISWLTNALAKELQGNAAHINTAVELWADLEERLAQGVAPPVYELKLAITLLQQEKSSISSYYEDESMHKEEKVFDFLMLSRIQLGIGDKTLFVVVAKATPKEVFEAVTTTLWSPCNLICFPVDDSAALGPMPFESSTESFPSIVKSPKKIILDPSTSATSPSHPVEPTQIGQKLGDNGEKRQAPTAAKQLSRKEGENGKKLLVVNWKQSNDPVILESSSAHGATTVMESHKDLVNSEVPTIQEAQQTSSENPAEHCHGTQPSDEPDLTQQLEFQNLKQLGFPFHDQNKINKKVKMITPRSYLACKFTSPLN
ncbi:hypothetical protein ACH5RR_029330 [Cinchona calisaya]|uniref:Retrotransposon gag domain-containing protein n=1 Tax=Cinchona calisaya TaxID=153742 RepID=A0ABD2YT01_9GENT